MQFFLNSNLSSLNHYFIFSLEQLLFPLWGTSVSSMRNARFPWEETVVTY